MKRAESAFQRRTRQLFGWHRQRARKYGVELDYDLSAFREIAWRAVLDIDGPYPKRCPFCGITITAETFGVDHNQPVARGGEHRLANLTVCCQPCNSAKGPLTGNEFAQLMSVVASWPSEIAKHTLARLKAGARVAKLNLKVAKSEPRIAA